MNQPGYLLMRKVNQNMNDNSYFPKTLSLSQFEVKKQQWKCGMCKEIKICKYGDVWTIVTHGFIGMQ